MNELKNKKHKDIKVATNIHAGKALGDAVADFTHQTGLDNLAVLYTNITGKDCGCSKRQQWLNEKFPDL